MITVDELAQEIRRVDGNHDKGAGALAEALMPFLTAALAAMPVPVVPCPCTTFEQDEDCPIGYPSLLCSVCKGTGIATTDAVTALAAEMLKVAEQVDEIEDPFAAWETIELLKSKRAITPATDMQAENERLREALTGFDWYWPENDTSSDACADGPWQIAENCDVKPGDVFGYSRGGIVETRYYGFLDAATDSGSDNQFEVDEPTREEAESKIAAELQRRAALERKP